MLCLFCFKYTPPPEIYPYGHTLARHDALPICSLELGTLLCNIRLRRSETRHSGVIFLLAYCLARDQPLIPIHVLLGICRCGTSPRERRLDRVQTGTQLPGVDRKQRLSRSNVGTFFVKASLDDTIYKIGRAHV